MEVSNTVRIRRAEAADNQLLAEFGARAFVDSFGADNTPEDMAAYVAGAFNPARQAAELAEPGSVFFLAEVDGDVAGYARVRRGSPPPEVGDLGRTVEITRIYARGDLIGRGVGAALMVACLDEAAARECDTVWLGVWNQNRRAIDFYLRWGFETVGSHEFRLGGDVQTDLVMRRPVRSEDHRPGGAP